MLACPNCQSRLIRDRSGPEVFWVCTACGGHAVRTSSLRRAIDRDTFDQVWSSACAGKGERKRTCPVCSRFMVTVALPRGLSLLPLDVCTDCKFVWFDAREYEALAETEVQTEEPEALLDRKWKWAPALFGMPVERESSVLLSKPWLTRTLASLVAVVSVGALFDPEMAVKQFGLIPAQLWRLGGLTFLTSFFVHGGLYHLIVNLYYLFVFGDNVEDYLGRGRYILLLLLATTTGDLLHIGFDPQSTVPVIGASGGISGVVAFYGLQFPRARVVVLVRWLFFYPLRIRARVALLLWILLQLLGAWQQMAGFSNISSLAHLGGAGMGLLFWLKWRSS